MLTETNDLSPLEALLVFSGCSICFELQRIYPDTAQLKSTLSALFLLGALPLWISFLGLSYAQTIVGAAFWVMGMLASVFYIASVRSAIIVCRVHRNMRPGSFFVC